MNSGSATVPDVEVYRELRDDEKASLEQKLAWYKERKHELQLDRFLTREREMMLRDEEYRMIGMIEDIERQLERGVRVVWENK